MNEFIPKRILQRTSGAPLSMQDRPFPHLNGYFERVQGDVVILTFHLLLDHVPRVIHVTRTFGSQALHKDIRRHAFDQIYFDAVRLTAFARLN